MHAESDRSGCRWRVTAAAAGVLSILAVSGANAQRPLPVAPGGTDAVAVVAGRCPTFHWTAVEGVDSVDLVVYRMPTVEPESPPERVLSITLPGTATGWTPALGRCLEPGGRYAWSVGVDGDWSEASLFEVSAAPSPAEVEEAMSVLRRFLGEQEVSEGLGGRDPEASIGTEISPRVRPESEEAQSHRAGDGHPRRRGVPPGDEDRDKGPMRPVPMEGLPAGGGTSHPPQVLAPGVVSASAVALSSSPSIKVDGQIHLGASSDIFRDGEVFLWTDGAPDSSFGSVALGLHALEGSSTGVNNTAVGHHAMQWNSTGSRNSAFGSGALQFNYGGSANSAFGEATLVTNSTGNSNSALGTWALALNNGSFNSALGTEALYWNRGNHNTAAGAYALHGNGTGNNTYSTGSNNTAAGAWALSGNEIGNDNTVVGFKAAAWNIEGNANTAVGTFALHRNTGQSNTAVGTNAIAGDGDVAVSGAENSALGFQALEKLQTGSKNTAVGQKALHENLVGDQNIALGDRAGFNVTGSSNIMIGHTGVADESNALRIGLCEGTGERCLDVVKIKGIYDRAVGGTNHPVYIDSDGQLGKLASSRRFKRDIRPLAGVSGRLLELEPVSFRFRSRWDEEQPVQFGLIAEQVVEVFPELVTRDAEGRPDSVRYHLLSSLLLNEFQRQHRQVVALSWLVGLLLVAALGLVAVQLRSA